MEAAKKHALFDAVIKEKGFKNDRAMCDALGVQPSHISRMRHGKLAVTDLVRVAIMRKTKWSLKRVDELEDAERVARLECEHVNDSAGE
jgi:hypothetical protein